MTESEFVAAFEDASLPETAFRHRDHVRLAWIYLRELPPPGIPGARTNGVRG